MITVHTITACRNLRTPFFHVIKYYVNKTLTKITTQKIRNQDMRKIRKTFAKSAISYYDRDGALQTLTTPGNVRTVEQAVKVLMKHDIYNVLVDDIKVDRQTYAMDAEHFFELAEPVPINDNETDDNDNE